MTEKSLSKYPPSAKLLADTAKQLLSPLLKEDVSIPYTHEHALKEQGTLITDKLFASKKELKGLVLLFVIEKIEKKSSTEEFIQSILHIVQNKCGEIAQDLNHFLSSTWPFQESIEEHLMLLFEDELLEELNQILRLPCDDLNHLDDKLLLLREAVEDMQAAFVKNTTILQNELQKINQNLQSVLHDAMIEKYSQAFLADIKEIRINSINR